jgi:hypothetical protein
MTAEQQMAAMPPGRRSDYRALVERLHEGGSERGSQVASGSPKSAQHGVTLPVSVKAESAGRPGLQVLN